MDKLRKDEPKLAQNFTMIFVEVRLCHGARLHVIDRRLLSFVRAQSCPALWKWGPEMALSVGYSSTPRE